MGASPLPGAGDERRGGVSPGRGRLALSCLCLGCLLVIGAATGCTSKRMHKPAWLMSRSDALRSLSEAVESPDPDTRREAVTRVSRTRHVSLPIAADTFAMVARTDSSETVRCAAIHALGQTPDAAAAMSTLEDVLEGPKRHGAVLPTGPDVRWTALETAYTLLARGGPPPDQGEEFCRLATGMLAGDPSRDVRIAAARLLELCRNARSLDALIAGLGQRDFGVAYACARSLGNLTGQSFQMDADRWTAWVASVEDPFANGRRQEARMASGPDRPWWRLDRIFSRRRNGAHVDRSGEARRDGAVARTD